MSFKKLIPCILIPLLLAACAAQPPSTTSQPSEIPTVEAVLNPTATSVPTETVLPPTATPEPIYITAFCTMIGKDVQTVVPQGTPIVITWGWEAKTQAQLDDFVENNITTVTLDGKTLDGTLNSAITKNEQSGQPEVAWFANVGVLEVGEHWITYDIQWKKMIEDGTTSYGPGSQYESLHDKCQVIVESTSSSSAVQ